ncbi:SCO family protein [Sphingomonas sp. LB-2]|uniref:SCO family protein n=1 Tax=Sphingomonas caeni TaxID=2984949 RepID=UPI0022322858|nr:SCO family protein [Sphingomonas caeni]MCW3846815.1 SCO family protein [Sphingomonas caeni]
MNSKNFRIATALVPMMLGALVLTSCGRAAPRGDPPLAGARIGGPFALTDQNGKTVRDSDFAGKYRLVYFGYTFCPDVCPTDMAKVSAVMRALDKSDPAIAVRLVPIFITVDPARDTPAALKAFAGNFDRRLVALTGSPDAIAATAKAYAVPFQVQKPDNDSGAYLVDHGTVTYLMGPKGEPIAALTHDMKPEEMIAEIKKWVR